MAPNGERRDKEVTLPMKPTIGVVPLVDSAQNRLGMAPGYLDGLLQAGAVPVMLPLTEDSALIGQLVDQMDGFLLPGGQDVAPERYRAQPQPGCGEPCPARDAMEMRLIRAALRQDKPLLGICRGIQLLNVYFGGTLFQDLPTQHPQGIDHRLPPASARPVHTVELVTGTPLHDLLHREKLPVNSTHHQAIRRLAPRLEVMALSEDGLIEAVYLPDYRFVWGVQWHPELNYAEEASSRRILDAFAHACKSSLRTRLRGAGAASSKQNPASA